jgi:uncharacterized membrane protein
MVVFDKQGFFGLLLSHHMVEDFHLTYALRVGSSTQHFCARCTGLYPAMFLTLLIGRLTPRWPFWLEGVFLFLAPLPALIDWGTSTATGKPERSNTIRMLTGIGLGIGLGTNLLINTRELLGPLVIAQLTFFLAVIWVVWLASYLRRRSNLNRRTRRLTR